MSCKKKECVKFPIDLPALFCTSDFDDDSHEEAGTGMLSGVTACFDVLMLRDSPASEALTVLESRAAAWIRKGLISMVVSALP